MKESSKKKLVRSTWVGYVVKKLEMKNLQKGLMPRKWKGNDGKEDRNCDGGLHYK